MERAEDRRIIRIAGGDRHGFLQGLITNAVPSPGDGLRYAALLTPQGKYLADFLILAQEDALLLDVKDALVAGLVQRLTLYKLRADVTIEQPDMPVWRGTGPAPEGALADPRHPALGWRHYGDGAPSGAAEDWDAIRVRHCIPESGIELIPNETFVIEAGFERLGGIDHAKGCYIGQEVMSRMKRKSTLTKGLETVKVEGEAPTGTPIMNGEREAGTLYTQAGGQGIAYLRFNRADGGALTAGTATVRRAQA